MTDYNFSLADAEALSPKRLKNQIVRDYDNMNRSNAYIATEVFPTYEMGASKEIFHRQDGSRMPMPSASLTSESPMAGLEDLDEDDITVETFKEKISPEKAVDEELNSEQEILQLARYVANALRGDMIQTRSMITWRGYGGVEGLIGPEGATAHGDLDTDHVFTPTNKFSNSNSDPHTELFNGKYLIKENGGGFEMLSGMVAHMSPSVIKDLSTHPDLENRFSGVQVQNIDEKDILESVLPIGEIREVNTQVVRTNANGEPIDENDNVVNSPEDAVKDNILEPYDASAGAVKRNIVLGMPGAASAIMPWHTDRLASHLDQTPTGEWSVNTDIGFLLQKWTQPDPAISFRKMAQEIGFKLVRPNNWVVFQDI